MKANVSSVDGVRSVECEEHAEVLGKDQAGVFGTFVAEKLIRLGATPILEEIEVNKLAKEAEARRKLAEAAASS